MNDPHVDALHYRLVPAENIDYDNAPVLEYENEDVKVRLSNYELILEPKPDFETEDAARLAMEPFLRSWELADAIERGRQEFSFEFDHATVVDRKPTPGVVSLSCGIRTEARVGTPTIKMHHVRFPKPPASFNASPDLRLLWKRYEDKGEPLTVFAYALLTYMEGKATKTRRRAKVAAHFNIAQSVLNNMGEITAKRGGIEEGRKIDSSAPRLTSQERAWLRAGIRLLLRRIGECEYDSHHRWPQITMDQLPRIR